MTTSPTPSGPTGSASPAAVDQLITWTFGIDPLAEATRLLAGDWDRALTCSQGLSAAAEFERLTAGNIGASASHCRDGWSGNAADAADRYLKDSARSSKPTVTRST